MNTTSLQSALPTLFELTPDGRTLRFFFKRCLSCAQLSFPATSPGCVHCGSEIDSAPLETHPGEGVLQEHVTIHIALSPGMTTPLTVGEIEIAPNIVKEAVIGTASDSELRPGMKMQAIANMDEDNSRYTCVFVPVEDES